MKPNKFVWIVFTIIMNLLLVTLTSSFLLTPTQDTYLQSSSIQINAFCFDTSCSSGVNCLINIYYPNSSLMVNKALMTWNSSYYYYNLNPSQTSLTGNYNGLVRCNSTNETRVSTFTYSISSTGNNVNDDVNNLSTNIWNYTNRSLSTSPDLTNYSAITSSIWNYNGTINSNILNQISYEVWNYAGSITIITNQAAQSIWTYVARYTHGEILN